MGFVAYDVWRVTSSPPTDPLLTGTLCSEGIEPEGLHFCILCEGLVFNSSHHCFRCRECAYDFDHHCKYLNVCVGGSNYLPFLGLLGSFILYCIAAIVLTLLQESCW